MSLEFSGPDIDKIGKPIAFGRRCIEETYKEHAARVAAFREVPDGCLITGEGLFYKGKGNNLKFKEKNGYLWIKKGNKGRLAMYENGVAREVTEADMSGENVILDATMTMLGKSAGERVDIGDVDKALKKMRSNIRSNSSHPMGRKPSLEVKFGPREKVLVFR